MPSERAGQLITPRRVLDVLKRAYQCASARAHREVYYAARGQFAGPWHGSSHDPLTRWAPVKGKTPFAAPVNRMSEMVEAYLPNLTGPNIETTLTPQRTQLKAWAMLRELRINQVIRTADLPAVDESVVQDAVLSGRGTYLVGLNSGTDTLQVSGALADQIEPNTPFVTRVPPSCMILDPTAGSDQTRAQFSAHIYTVQRDYVLELAQEIGLDADLVNQVPCIEDVGSRMIDDPAFNATNAHRDDYLFDHICLIDVIMYSGRKAYKATLPPWDGADFWLIEPMEWSGADKGRYEHMTLRKVNDQVAPKSPAQDLMDLHLALAASAGKMVRQVLRAGRRYLYHPDHEDAAVDIRDGGDDELIKSENPGVLNEIEVGGMLDSMLPAYQWMSNEAEQTTINPKLATGREDSSNTATGATIIAGKADKILGSIRNKRETALNAVSRRIGMALDQGDDRKRVLQKMYLIAGKSIPVEFSYDPSRREGAFDQFDYMTQVSTVAAMEPRQRQLGITEFMRVMPGFIQAVAMMGGNVSAAMRLLQRAYEQPEIGQIFPTADTQMQDAILKSLAPDVMGTGPTGMQPIKSGAGAGGGGMGKTAQIQSDYSQRVPV